MHKHLIMSARRIRNNERECEWPIDTCWTNDGENENLNGLCGSMQSARIADGSIVGNAQSLRRKQHTESEK
jgi:hypothetical protein